jgi:hypothetical protein
MQDIGPASESAPLHGTQETAELETKIECLEAEIERLNAHNLQLEGQLSELRMHPVLLAGLKGETVVCKAVNGRMTEYASKYDVAIGDTIKIEVKCSKLNTPIKSRPSYRRWNWDKPLGYRGKGKQYDFLILMGERNFRYKLQSPGTEYVYFLVPKEHVQEVMTGGKGGSIEMDSNINRARKKTPKQNALRKFLVSIDVIAALSIAPENNGGV